MLIKINERISVEEALTHITHAEAGGQNLFIGTVRDHTAKRKVEKLWFECYEPMALNEMQKIAEEAKKQFELHKIAILHAIGEKQVNEQVVIIAVAAAHRDAAFTACRYCIDRLKERVPIWKKEYFEDGEVWVSAHP